ncbi:endolytic transglycosylase MltG [Marinomonas arenicola]|uniref:endolytic transglycosylase MltG n=1 Tax=Marinomonas arenicola TaxID=569601 RepID=UPI00311F147F
MTLFKWFIRVFVLAASLLAVLAGVVYYLLTSPINLDKEARFYIQSGDTSYKIGHELSEKNWILDPMLMRVVARLHPEWVPKVGEYAIMPGMTILDLMTLFDSGRSVVYSVTLLEGKTLDYYLATMAAKGNIKMTLKGLTNEQIAKRFALDVSNPEGQFFANTYQYHEGDTDFSILQHSHRLLEQTLADLWDKRDKNLPYKNAYEALVMASIIEKETGAPIERPLISRVFISRLEKGMRLQTDPTVIYGLGKNFNGNLTRKDLRSASPYNTYLHFGLPPTPIANVGKEAIEAALNPGETKALYFVAKGDGTHAFSNTLQAHNRAVAKYQKYHRRSDYKSIPESTVKENAQ